MLPTCGHLKPACERLVFGADMPRGKRGQTPSRKRVRSGTRPFASAKPPTLESVPRPPRICFPGALYHVTARGNDRVDVVRDNTDRQALVDLIAEVTLPPLGVVWLVPE